MGFDEGQGITGGSNETFVAVAEGSSFYEDDDIGVDRVTGVSLDNEAEFSVVDEEFLEDGQLGVGGIDNVVVLPDNGLISLHDRVVMRSLDEGESGGRIDLDVLGKAGGGNGGSEGGHDEEDGHDSEHLDNALEEIVGLLGLVDVVDGVGDVVAAEGAVSIKIELGSGVLEVLGKVGNEDSHLGKRVGKKLGVLRVKESFQIVRFSFYDMYWSDF
jgi:hypothetical protein